MGIYSQWASSYSFIPVFLKLWSFFVMFWRSICIWFRLLSSDEFFSFSLFPQFESFFKHVLFKHASHKFWLLIRKKLKLKYKKKKHFTVLGILSCAWCFSMIDGFNTVDNGNSSSFNRCRLIFPIIETLVIYLSWKHFIDEELYADEDIVGLICHIWCVSAYH